MANLANFFSFSFLLLVLLSMDSFFSIFFNFTLLPLYFCMYPHAVTVLFVYSCFFYQYFFPFSHFFDIFWIRHGLLQQSVIELFGLN